MTAFYEAWGRHPIRCRGSHYFGYKKKFIHNKYNQAKMLMKRTNTRIDDENWKKV